MDFINIAEMSRPKEIFRRTTSLIFLLAFLMQSFSKDFVVLDYYINTDSYAKNCVNKEKPKLQCKGKCQMMKKVKDETKKDQGQSDGNTRIKRDVFLSSKSFFPSLPNFFPAKKSQLILFTSNVIVSDYVYGIFHPPRV